MPDDAQFSDDAAADDSFSFENDAQQTNGYAEPDAAQGTEDLDFSLESSNDPTPPSLQWGEDGDGGIPADFHEGLAQVVKDLGFDNARSARLLAKGYQYAMQRDAELTRSIGNDLRKQWGNDFNANIRETKRFWNETLRGANIPPQARAILGSPYGMMLGNYLRTRVQGGEASRYAGSGNTQSPKTAQQQIDEIYANPKTSRATWDSSDPLYTEVQAKLNQLMGVMNE